MKPSKPQYSKKWLEFLLQEKDKEVNTIKNDLLYVLEQIDGWLNKNWTIDLNFTDIREKYKQDIEEYESLE